MDPLSLVRPLALDPRRAEVAALFASTLAIGNTTAIRSSFTQLVQRFSGDPFLAVQGSRQERQARLRGFRHRWIRDDQLLALSDVLSDLYASGETLERVFVKGMASGGEFADGLDALARCLRGADGRPIPRGYAQLFPSPRDRSKSACKRLTLCARWLVRRQYPDLGAWSKVSPAALHIPLDQHVYWISYHLGLTGRRTRNWATVEEVTASLREVDPADPIKFDFVLCHTGISGDCPKRRDLGICGPCVVRPDCLLWHGRRPAVGAT
jgi:uncharacterized protein (TIGR02757 family)